ncbi:hypothetical protein [Permianibacter aggregans]|uniref:hypothetical protein n=1 Tax=Permianibacter aggregans TaxID=1510150 RepID=UPI0012F938BD|nr:hypothetical protein [Permianibacter aggregans]
MNLPRLALIPNNWRSVLSALLRTLVLLALLSVGCRLTLAIFGEALALIGR